MFSKTYGQPQVQFAKTNFENASWPRILKEFKLKKIDMSTAFGRADFEGWLLNTMSHYFPFSMLQHSGNTTGTFETLAKDGIPKKQWNEIKRRCYKGDGRKQASWCCN